MAEDNFYIINSWMIDELNLSGIELQVFAIIWSLSRGEKQMYIAGNAHLVRMTKKSEPTIIAALKKLCEKKLIEKIPVVVNKVERNYYKAINQGTKESLGGYLKNLSGGTKEILAPNNKEIYKENNNSLTHIACAERNYLQEEYYKLMDDLSWKEVICMNYHLTMDELRKTLIEFFLDCKCAGTIQHQNEQDAKSHFNSWLKKKNNGNNSTNIRKQQKRGKTLDEFIEDSIAELHRSKPEV